MNQRFALYSATEAVSPAALIHAARLANRDGGRVVTIVSEHQHSAAASPAQALAGVLQRLRKGEFDKVIACANRREWRRACKIHTKGLKPNHGGGR